jgi:glyoxylase-like metal-dependent hydrolase (beta-lactamase superfamily II)
LLSRGMFLLWLVAAAAAAGALTARFYYGITVEQAATYVLMRTPIGVLIHDMAIQRCAGLQHSKPALHDCGSFLVRIVAFLEDNLAYIVIDKSTGRTAIVDPGDGKRCLDHLKDVQLQYDELKATQRERGASGNSSPSGTRITFSSDQTMLLQARTRVRSRTVLAIFVMLSSIAPVSVLQVQNRPELTTALVTHHHLDHSGGIPALKQAVPELRIIAGQKEAVPQTNAPATHGARVWLGATEIDVLATPCHTRGEVCVL